MSKSNVIELEEREGITDPLTVLLRARSTATDSTSGGSGIRRTPGTA